MHELVEPTQAREKAPKTTLEVRIGKKVIRHRIAAHVFCDALQAMGLERVTPVGLTACGLPLISRVGPPSKNGAPRGYREIDGWFIVTHSSTREKKAILEQAADALKIPIEVRVLTMSDFLFAVVQD